MISKLLSNDVQSFLTDHYLSDPQQLLLKYRTISGLPASIIVDQLTGRRKAEERLPTWHSNKNIIYPPAVNLEQSSSEKSALVKVDLLESHMGDLRGKILLDLTGGFGVDSYFFSKAFKHVHVVEPNGELLQITRHNHRELDSHNISYYNMSAESFLKSSPLKSADVIFLDPSRRIIGDKKVYSLSESLPSVVALQPALLELSANLLIKTSPLLDIQVGLNELEFVKHVYITSVNNDCKEVLFFSERNFKSEPTITAININDMDENFSFRLSEERTAENQYSDPLDFIYEPNASLLKSGAFKILGAAFNLHKLHPNTHLYTSQTFNNHFPGRVFQIETIARPNEKLTELFEGGKVNIFTRNYPLTVDAIRKKYRLKDGGEKYLIACTGIKKKFLLIAKRVR